MSQLLKKFALLTACAVLALCFMARPAQAQAPSADTAMVAAGGAGEHLFFAYWSTANYMNTHVNIHSPLGTTDEFEKPNAVYVRIRDAEADPDDNIVASFMICLTGGDTWTATISEEGLMVRDPGGCDESLRQPATNPSNMNVNTPTKDGDPVDLGEADSGYLEAWLRPVNALQDDKWGTRDATFLPEHAIPRNISGTAMLVSPMSGFSSSYDAVALSGCQIVDGNGMTIGADGSIDEDAAADTSFVDTDTTTTGLQANNMGCWRDPDSPLPDGTTAAAADQRPMLVTEALMDEDKEFLIGRWTAIMNDEVTSHTKVVLTFPSPQFDRDNGTLDPLSVRVYDDTGKTVITSAGLELGMGVNMCMFGMMHMDDMDMHDDDMDMMDMLSCNGKNVGSFGKAESGGFRIYNNMPSDMASDTNPETPGDSAGAQTPMQSLAAIGLIFSYFEGNDGMMQYDQATPVQWLSVNEMDSDDADGTDENHVDDLMTTSS